MYTFSGISIKEVPMNLRLRKRVLRANEARLHIIDFSSNLSNNANNKSVNNINYCSVCSRALNRRSTLNKRSSPPPSFDELMDSIKAYDPVFKEKTEILKLNASGVASGDAASKALFTRTLDELKQGMSELNQEAAVTKIEMDNYRTQVEDEIRQWGENSGLENWQHEIDHMTLTMSDYMNWATEEEWREQKISICRNDPHHSIQPIVLTRIVTQNRYDFALRGGQILALVMNTIAAVYDALVAIEGSDLLLILNIRIRALESTWQDLIDFVNQVETKNYLLEDCNS